MNVVQVNAGFGRHMALLSVHQRMEALKWNWLASPFLVLSLATSKVSICLFLLRVLKKTHAKRRKYFLYLIIGSIVGLSVPAAGYCLGQCQPVEKLWNKKVPGFCHDHDIFVKVGYTYGGRGRLSAIDMATLILSASHECSIRLRTRSFPNDIDKRPQIRDTKTYRSWHPDVLWSCVCHRMPFLQA